MMRDRGVKDKGKHAGRGLSEVEKCLLDLLGQELTGQTAWEEAPSLDWEELAHIAMRHGVLPLLYRSLTEWEQVPPRVKKQAEISARSVVQQSYRLLFLSKYLLEGLEKAGIQAVLLKGVGTAGFYPVPELRKAGDVDLLLPDSGKEKQAATVLRRLKCTEEEWQPSLHHIVYRSFEGTEIELHTMLAEPFDNSRMNRYMEAVTAECAAHIERADIMGVELPVLSTAYHAYELLLHMLQHFLRSGFGLKLLCDWVVFWNRETDAQEQERYLKLVEESGVKGFSDMVTLACCQYLGLPVERVGWMRLPKDYCVESFLLEILEAEEFGKSSKDRMVTLRGNKIMDYVREFHHQMRLNFPKGSRCILCWPALWVITLARFMRNNRKIRKTSGLAILKKAGQRSKMMEQMKLFQ